MSERKINLEDIWKQKYPYGKLPQYARDIAIEFAKQLLELAAENAEGDIVDDTNYSNGRVVIDKQSILNTINQIE